MGADNEKTSRKQRLQDPVEDNRLHPGAVIGEQVITQEHSVKASVRQCIEEVMMLPGNTFFECLVDSKVVATN